MRLAIALSQHRCGIGLEYQRVSRFSAGSAIAPPQDLLRKNGGRDERCVAPHAGNAREHVIARPATKAHAREAPDVALPRPSNPQVGNRTRYHRSIPSVSQNWLYFWSRWEAKRSMRRFCATFSVRYSTFLHRSGRSTLIASRLRKKFALSCGNCLRRKRVPTVF